MQKPGRKQFIQLGAILLLSVLYKLVFFPWHEFGGPDMVFNTAAIALVWVGNTAIDQWLNTTYSWINEPKKRFVIEISCCLIFTACTIFLFTMLMHYFRFGEIEVFNRKIKQIFFPSLLITLILLAFYISTQFYDALKNSLLEVEKYKTESANAQLQNLKNQLNPHFLFNNLSVLSSLVYKNQDKAVDFINDFAKVYRYVLDTKNSELVTLQEELDFLEHYIHLLKIRFDNSISFAFTIEEAQKRAFLLPMCLQTLVENIIQHNEASQANPLQVVIYTQHNSIIVKNPIQPRNDWVSSSKTGLKNIKLRYSFFTSRPVGISTEGGIFSVTLPLLSGK